ncbi:MAG: PDZ domain-containing protein [Sedimentisphaerales bacterium]|nr:PDZ domain-containing protein [Sedimentisphaerales bacterium]
MKYKQYIAAFSILIIISLSGCSSIENEKFEKTNKNKKYVKSLQTRYFGNSTFNFNSENLKKVEFEGDIIVGQTRIKYQKGFESQARNIAKKLDNVFSYVKTETGIEFAINPQVYLLRVQEYPQSINVHFKIEDPNIFPIPIFAEVGHDDPNQIIEDNHFFPYMLAHEITEASLMYPDGKGVVKGDSRFRILFLIIDQNNYTRWFRDGFANYAGYVAMDYLRSNPDENMSDIWGTTYMHQTPFRSLMDIGKELFKWSQVSSPRKKGDYYSAALGLFLLLEDEYGRDAIRNIIIELDNYEALKGSDVIKLINTKLDTDIKKLAEDFKFMTIGINIYQLTPAMALNKGLEPEEGLFVKTIEPNSIAQEVGIDANDVIVAINDKPIATSFDFEMELFKAMKQPKAQFKIWRKGEGYKEIQISMDKTSKITAGKKPKKSKAAKSVSGFGISFSYKTEKGSKKKE